MGGLFTRDELFTLSADWMTIILLEVEVIYVNTFGF